MRIGGSLEPRVPSIRRVQIAIRSPDGKLEDLINDAAKRGMTGRAAEDLLLRTAIVCWPLDGGDLPAKGSIELMEIQGAISNGARHEEELELQWVFAEALGPRRGARGGNYHRPVARATGRRRGHPGERHRGDAA